MSSDPHSDNRLIPLQFGDLRGMGKPAFARLPLNEIPWDILREQPHEKFEPVKASHTRRVASFMFGPEIPDAEPVRVFVKRSLIRGARRAMMSRFKSSKARREFNLLCQMQEQDIAAPTPVAWVEKRKGSRLVESQLAILELRGFISCKDLLTDLKTGGERLHALTSLARFINESLNKGFQHTDCSLNHVFVRKDDAYEMAFIDVDGSRLNARPSRRARLKIAFQLIRSAPENSLSREERRALLSALLETDLSAREFQRCMRRIDGWEQYKKTRKKILKALRLKRRG